MTLYNDQWGKAGKGNTSCGPLEKSYPTKTQHYTTIVTGICMGKPSKFNLTVRTSKIMRDLMVAAGD
jgi:hypothetical protein